MTTKKQWNTSEHRSSAARPAEYLSQDGRSAAQPAPGNFLPLAQLNKASVKIGGEWCVIVFRPIEDNYEYTYQGKQRKGTNFLVTLVSAEDPSQYCQGQLKKNTKNTAKYEQVKQAMEHG